MGWIYPPEQPVYSPELEQGVLYFADGQPADDSSNTFARIRTKYFTTLSAGTWTVQTTPTLYCMVFLYDSNENYESYMPSSWYSGEYSFTLSSTKKVKVVFNRNSSTNVAISPSDIQSFTISMDSMIQWEQDDSKFFGFPFVTDSGIADEFNGTNSIWSLKDGEFFGFPFIQKSGIADEFNNTNSIWELQNGVFFNFPFIKSAGVAPKYEEKRFLNLYIGQN